MFGAPARIAGLSPVKILAELLNSQSSDSQTGSHRGDTNAGINAMSAVITLRCGDDADFNHVPWIHRMSQSMCDSADYLLCKKSLIVVIPPEHKQKCRLTASRDTSA